MKKIFILLFCFVALSTEAQNSVKNFIKKLEQPDLLTGASVVITLDQKSENVLSSLVEKYNIYGQTIVLFNDGSQNGRERAIAAKSLFDSKFPEIPSYLEYTGVQFEVTAGEFMNKAEANKVFSLIKPFFPSANLRSKEIPLRTFIRRTSDQPFSIAIIEESK